MKRRLLAYASLILVLLVLGNLVWGPVLLRVPLVDWTYQDGHAVAGLTLWPFVVLIDEGPQGPAVLAHEMCHWRHPAWPEWACDAMDEEE